MGIEVRRLVKTFGTLWVLNSPGTADLSRSSVSRSIVSKQKADCIKKKKTIQFNISHTGKFRLGSRPSCRLPRNHIKEELLTFFQDLVP